MDDRELGRLFGKARREDEGRAPRLSELLARPARVRPERTVPARRLIPALVVVVLLAVGLAIFRPPEPVALERSPAAGPFLSQPRWVAPTDFLLKPPYGELWSTTPPIGAPLPALDSGSDEPTKGTRT